MKDITTVILHINHVLSIGKKELQTYLTDKTNPLDDRWLVFCKAPISLKNTGSWIVTFDWEKEYGEIDWFEDYYCYKYQSIIMEDLIVSMEEAEEPNLKATKDMKEESLSKNLHSFVMDW